MAILTKMCFQFYISISDTLIFQQILLFHIYYNLRLSIKILDKDFKNGFVSAFQYAVKAVSYYLHIIMVSFLETCKSYELCPTGLSIRKKPFIEFESDC